MFTKQARVEVIRPLLIIHYKYSGFQAGVFTPEIHTLNTFEGILNFS